MRQSATLIYALALVLPVAGAREPVSTSTAGLTTVFASGFEQVISAASCSATDVQAALDAATDDTLVLIPAGDCDWGATQVSRDAGITLRGAGRLLTTIRRTAPMPDYDNATLEINCANGQTVEISDLRLVGNDELQTEEQRLLDQDVGVSLINGCIDFEVHDVEISKFSHAALSIRGSGARGVVYESDFVSNFRCQPSPVSCLGYGIVIAGDASAPAPPLALGGGEAVFIEDNYFHDNRHAVASNYGSRYVVRHNTLVTTARTRNFGMIDAHGRQSGSSLGSRSWEIYRNTLRKDPASMTSDGISLRGGDGVVFENTLEAGIPYVVSLRNETCSGPYPLPDQIREAHIWGNQWSPVPGYNQAPIWIGSGCQPYLWEGRDYFLSARPGYVPYPYPHPLR